MEVHGETFSNLKATTLCYQTVKNSSLPKDHHPTTYSNSTRTHLVLLSVDDEEDEHDQVLLVAPQVVSILSSRDAVEYNQVLCVAHCGHDVAKPDRNVLLQIVSVISTSWNDSYENAVMLY